MKITYSKKNLNIGDSQIEYITKKIDHLKTLAKRVDDESSHAEIEIEKVSSSFKNISMTINFKVPSKLFRAETLANTVEEAIDLCEEKLKIQIEKYKSKFGTTDMHTGQVNKKEEDNDIENEFADLI